MVQSSQRCSFVTAYETLQEIPISTATFSGGFTQAQPHFPGDSWDKIRGVPGDSEATMRIVSCEKQYKNWYKCKLWQGIPPTELHPFIILKKRFGVFQENVHLRA